MAVFYFIRHGQADFREANTKIYQGRGFHLLTLSPLGQEQIRAAAGDARLREARVLLSSPFGRALHSAAILSKELGLEIRVETDLHEWLADGVDYAFLPQEEADARFRELREYRGGHPQGGARGWETAEQMRKRVFAVLERYREDGCAIVCCHGTLMEYALGVEHPANGEIVKYEY